MAASAASSSDLGLPCDIFISLEANRQKILIANGTISFVVFARVLVFVTNFVFSSTHHLIFTFDDNQIRGDVSLDLQSIK
jgi:hypothetical protein